MQPIRLEPNLLERFYRGGERIARFRGLAPVERRPEDWVGSATTARGDARVGLSTLPDGRLLRNAVAAEPEAFLGREHVAAFGAEPALLVKLLDAGERLPVHLHPDRAFAREHLGSRFGKAEAWLVLEGGTLHVGFREDVEPATLRSWFEAQDVEAMLAASNELQVERGDCVYVPAGTPHAIGEGVFMLEVQEPSDLGILVEFERFTSREGATMGLPVETALAATRTAAVSDEELASWRRARSLPAESERFFRVEWSRGGSFDPSFAILVAVDGAGRLETEAGALELARGDTVLVPFGAGAGELSDGVEAIRCLPPRP